MRTPHNVGYVGYSNDNVVRMCILRYLTKTNENLSACTQAHFVVLPTPSEYKIRTPALSMVHHRQTLNIQSTFCHTHWNRTTVLQSIQTTLKHCNVSNQCYGQLCSYYSNWLISRFNARTFKIMEHPWQCHVPYASATLANLCPLLLRLNCFHSNETMCMIAASATENSLFTWRFIQSTYSCVVQVRAIANSMNAFANSKNTPSCIHKLPHSVRTLM